MVDATISKDVTNQINTLIQNVFGGSTLMNIEFVDNVSLPYAADANTDQKGGISNGILNVQVQLNSNYLQNYSQQYIARVIMHEALHAYLDAVGRDESLQHEDMAVKYVTIMAKSLQQMFSGLVDQDAKNLALGGLQFTPTFMGTIQNDLNLQSSFTSTNLAYSIGASGTRCK